MRFRDATLDDLPRVVDIYNQSIPDRMATSDLEPVSVAQRLDWFAQHSPTRHPIWLASQDEASTAQAWLSFSAWHQRCAYHISAELSIYVDTAARGQGYGKALLQHALAQAPTLGFQRLMAVIFAHNLPSVELFKGCGFEPWGRLPEVAELDGKLRDVVILGYKLT